MQRYFVTNQQISGGTVLILGNDCHHIKNVMRMQPGMAVEAADEGGNVYACVIEQMTSNQVILKIEKKLDRNTELPWDVTIAMGLTKFPKQEEVLRRITELGAAGFVSVEMARSVLKLAFASEGKLDRMALIVKEASEQSLRNKLLKVFSITSFKGFLEMSKNFDLCLYAYEERGKADDFSLKRILQKFNGRSILFLTGPEGGISPQEAEELDQSGFHAVGLGPRILRCETAPLYAMAVISYEAELKNES
jgi:16S rRNA (uracil1498-N3)-methyltransferase